MKILIIGGTLFIGRAIVEAATSRHHELTLFHRGRTNRDLFPTLEHVYGDRMVERDLKVLKDRQWDAVIDLPGYVPSVVRLSAGHLRESAAQYVFISTISVYDYARLAPSHLNTERPDESAPLRVLADPTDEESREDTYGGLKVLCERVVQEVMGVERSLIVRPGVVIGPYDPTDRFTYWVMRLARGGEVLVPGCPQQRIQIIDARDLADWVLGRVEQQQAGVFNVTGPQGGISFGEMLEHCRAATGGDARLTWVDEEWLIRQGVKPLVDLPLWVPQNDSGWLNLRVDQALAHGLHFRSIAETARDTLRWASARRSNRTWQAGLDAVREQVLLTRWRDHVNEF